MADRVLGLVPFLVPPKAKWLKLPRLAIFVGTKNGTLGARIEILRPLVNKNVFQKIGFGKVERWSRYPADRCPRKSWSCHTKRDYLDLITLSISTIFIMIIYQTMTET